MKKIRGFLLGLTLVAPTVQATSPSVVGSWKIQFYLENSRLNGAQQCFNLVSVPGRVADVPTSGTWTSPSFPGWSGEWIQLGDHIRIFGVTSSLATTASGNISSSSALEGVSFNHFSKTNAATSSAGSWHGVRVSNCNPISIQNNDLQDPAEK